MQEPCREAITPVDQVTRENQEPSDPEMARSLCRGGRGRRHQDGARATEERQEGEPIGNEDTVFADQLSLSRLNHWLPWAQAHPEVMQGTTEFHHQIADTFFP